MMNFIINKILQYMQKNHLIDDEDVELYQYGIHVMFLKLVHYFSILGVGFFLNREWELIIFLVCYTVLRSYTGGYHAKHAGTCLLISILMILFMHYTMDSIPKNVAVSVALLSMLLILLCNSTFMIKKEESQHRKMSMLLGVLLFIVVFFLSLANIKKGYLPICYSLFYTSFYLLVQQYQKRKGKVNE